MSLDPGQRLTQDDRDGLAVAAQAARRRNRPRSAVLLGALALAIGLGVLAWGTMSDRGAVSRLRSARANLGKMQQMIAELESLRERAESSAVDEFTPIGDLELRIRDIARAHDLEIPGPDRRTESVRGGTAGLEQVSLSYRVSGAEPTPILDWIQESIDQIPGLRLAALTVAVRSGAWDVQVTFERYERENA